MKKLVDIHTHLNTLPSWTLTRSKMQGHVLELESLANKNYQILFNVAIYPLYPQSFTCILDMISHLKKNISKSSCHVKLITQKRDLLSDFNIGIILHLESARFVTDIKEQVPLLFDHGIRGIIPIHFVDNQFGTSCDDPMRRFNLKTRDSGLSDLGHKLVEKMNALKMWVDLSHTTDQTANDIIEIADNIMISHVGIRDLIDRKRNKPISQLKKIACKNGLIGITPWQHLVGIKKSSFQETLSFALSHDLNSSLCIGSDFGAPIKTYPGLNSIYVLESEIDQLIDVQDKEDIKQENAFNYFTRVLPD